MISTINSAMVEAYWEIGRQIAEVQGERAESNWSVRKLERQINSFFYERLLATQKSGRESVENEIED